MQLGLNESEIRMIKKWKRKHDNNIALYFFNKYKDDILRIIYGKINRKFSSIPMEKGDFFHIVWKSVLRCLKKCNLNSNTDFKSMITSNAYHYSIKEALKFLSNKHIVLNTAYSYENLLENKQAYKLSNSSSVEIQDTYAQAREKFIEKVVEFNKLYDIKFLKRVIYYKSLGYTFQEIADVLNKKHCEIQKVIEYICEITKKLYD